MAEKKPLTVTLQVQELVYDALNKAHLTGRAREAEGQKNYEAASNMQASDDSEDRYQIRRSLAYAFSLLKSMLGEFLSEDTTTGDNRINNEIETDGVLTLAFELPSNHNDASSDSVTQSIHSYLVDMALGDWFSITNKEDADIYISHSAVSLESVKRALFKRSRPTRPTYDTTDTTS